MEKGDAIGVAKTARLMKSEGIPVEMIVRITGLTEEAVRNL